MQIEEIIRRVKAEADADADAACASQAEQPSDRNWQDAVPPSQSRQPLREMLSIDRDGWLAALYRRVRSRALNPAAGVVGQKLAAAVLSLIMLVERVLGSLMKPAPDNVAPSFPRRVFACLRRIPLLGYLLDITVTLVRLPVLKQNVTVLTEDARHLKTGLAMKADRTELALKADRTELAPKADRTELPAKVDRAELVQLADHSEAQLTLVREDLASKADRGELLAYRAAVQYAELYFHGVSQELQALLRTLREPAIVAGALAPVSEQVAALAAGLYDKLYLDFESLYRGTEQQVSTGLTAYAHLLALPSSAASPPTPAIDLGSGRGEMVRYLGELGYAATGVDLNRVAVSSCQEAGLPAVHADALAYLEQLEPGSVSLITSLHLVEHLHHVELFQLLQEALEVLAPGGMLLLETPNPRNLLVGASDFYRDFTHVKPFFPDTLRFLLDYFGYLDAQTFFFEEAKEGGRRLVAAGDVRFDELGDYLKVSRDYAVVGYKRCG